jgi:glycosyltransferase involved in cell wall biosynthesis
MVETTHPPLVSVIIPTRDRCALLVETLASIQAQTYPHWEAVVVDDLSNDNTWHLLQDLTACDPRIRAFRRNGSAGGASAARNQGFAVSQGPFVIFLDSDDLLAPTAIESRLRMAAAHPDSDAVVFQSEYFRRSPGEYSGECALAIRLFEEADPLDAFLTGRSPWLTCGPLWRRAALERVGPWDADNHFLDDLLYHVRALIVGIRFERFQIVDQYIRVHQGPQVSRSNNSGRISGRLRLFDAVLALLRGGGMLTRRRKRMIAWSALLQTLAYATERPRPALRSTLPLWRAARARGLVGAPGYVAGLVLILSQWANAAGPLPRELARLIVHYDLRRPPVFHKSFFSAFGHYLKWMLVHYWNWFRARRAASARSVTPAEDQV